MLTFILGTAGVAAAVFATAFAGWQAYLLRLQLEKSDIVSRAEFYQIITKSTLELNRIFIEKPDLRPIFYSNQSPTSETQRQQGLALAGYIFDLCESVTAAEPALPHLAGDWDDHFNFLYLNSPMMREWWSTMGHLYPDEVKRAIFGPSLRPKTWPPYMIRRPGDA